MPSTGQKDSRRILIFSAIYLPHIGGIEIFTKNLSESLASRGYFVDIVTNNINKIKSYEKISDKISIYRFPCLSLFNGRMPIPIINIQFIELWRKIKSLQYRGILINARFYPHTLLGLIFSKIKKITPVLLDHGSAYLTFGNRSVDMLIKVYEHVITTIAKLFKPKFFCISKKSTEWLKTFNIEADGIIHNSIDASAFRSANSNRDFQKEFGYPADEFIVSFYGRLIPEKGINYLLDAASLLQNYPIRFLIAGDGPLRSTVESSLLNSVTYLGRLEASDISALLSQSDVMCLPSRSEGFSTALLEASACGVPSIIPNVGGVEELLPDASYGYIIDELSSDSIASAIYDAYINVDDLRVKGEKIKERVEKYYNWNSVALELINIFESQFR